MGALHARLGPALFAALLTVVVVTPIFGLRLERAGTRTVLVPQWHYVIWGCAIVFVWQLLRPAVATATRGIRLPALPALSDRLRPLALLAVLAIAFIWPFFAGRNAVDIATLVLIYVMLGLGLNIVVGFAGLLDLGFVGFYATGAYTFAMLYHWAGWSFWHALPLSGAVSALFGFLLGFPVLRLRGDYLAIVTLGFGEIIRVFLNNLEYPFNITNGPRGLDRIDSMNIFGFSFGKAIEIGGFRIPSVTLYYYLFLVLVVLSVVVCHRLETSRIGRAWMAIREDEVAAKAMGINTRNMKLLAFGMGATFGGVSGAMFASFQGFVSPESFTLMESIMIVAMVVLGGLGHIPGVIVGALMLAALPEVLRYVAGDVQNMTGGRIDSAILRQLLIALAMIVIMLMRPRGLWPSPEHGKAAPAPV